MKTTLVATALLLLGGTAALAQQPYGAQGTMGPAGAAVRTCTGVPSCVVVGPTDAWEAAIETAAPGATVLLRGGTYAATTSLVVPAGTPTALITVANFNGEVPVLPRTLIPRSNNRFEGLAIEAFNNSFVIDLVSTTSTQVSNIVFKNLRIRGATSDAVRVKGNIANVTLENSDIDGGRDHHGVLSDCDVDTSTGCTFTVENIVVRNNHMSKNISYPTSAGEDIIQVEGAGTFTIERNTFENNPNGEECVDTKPYGRSGGSLIVRANIISSNCGGLLFWQRTATGRDVIENNLIGGGLIRGTATGSEVRNNVIVGAEFTVASSDFRAAFGHNTFTGTGNALTFGDSTGQPGNIQTVNNIFNRTAFMGASGTHNAVGNLLFGTSGGTLGTCTNCFSGDPLLSEVYKIGSGSPAINHASNTYTVPTDIEGTTRPQGVSSDIGAYEFASTQPPAPTASLTANPATINPGASSTLTWSSTNATGCTGTNFSTNGTVSGQQVVSPSATTNYSVNCSGAVANATVTVQTPPPADDIDPIVDILAPLNGAQVRRNTNVNVTVDASDPESGVNTVRLTIEGVVVATFTGDGSHTFVWRPGGKPNHAALIQAMATDNAGNSASDSVTVQVTR